MSSPTLGGGVGGGGGGGWGGGDIILPIMWQKLNSVGKPKTFNQKPRRKYYS